MTPACSSVLKTTFYVYVPVVVVGDTLILVLEPLNLVAALNERSHKTARRHHLGNAVIHFFIPPHPVQLPLDVDVCPDIQKGQYLYIRPADNLFFFFCIYNYIITIFCVSKGRRTFLCFGCHGDRMTLSFIGSRSDSRFR